MTIDPATVQQVANSLTPIQRRAIDELDDYYGRGPNHLSPVLHITTKEAREILQFFHKEGICDFGFLTDDDSGALRGRGYWLDLFGKAVQKIVREDA